jgi:hypothetical protein
MQGGGRGCTFRKDDYSIGGKGRGWKARMRCNPRCRIGLMRLLHHGSEIELDDDWWAEAGMVGFVPKSKTYCVDLAFSDRVSEMICIQDVSFVRRAPGVGIFNDSVEDGTAHDRVVRILRGFQPGDAIPPVEIVEDDSGQHRYRLVNGAHRLYCSLAAGFTHVPAIKGIDWSSMDN